jgi:RimJ/RimL family protein N-acetyltransferase
MNDLWINHPIVLQGNTVELHPLEAENFEKLLEAASNQEIWELTSVNYSVPEIFYSNSNAALQGRENGTVYPFVIIDKSTKEIIGTTRFLDIMSSDKKLEIGVTWIKKEYWGSIVNLECKLLLLSYSFDVLNANRVQFRAKADNIRSRKAIEKIGGVFEGVFRKDKIEPNGYSRDTAFFSIIDSEWENAKKMIELKIEEKVNC